jgi:predicted ATPase/DNA-binding CsgD family transcriptional regulator
LKKSGPNGQSQRRQDRDLLHSPGIQASFEHLTSTAVTTLIGREQEINTLCSLLQQPDIRLVTLSGPGGVGKTQLALQVGAALSATFADGVSIVSLASITTVELVIATIAHVLGIKERREALSLEMVKMALRNQEMLLLLDNFEQVLAAGSLLTDLLGSCSGVKMLVTSRAVLRVQGEYCFPVAPLPLPDLAHLPELQTLSQIPAVALFVQRTQRIRADFHLTQANTHSVAEICVLLDGLPLALELAAARMKLFSPLVLQRELKQSMMLLGQAWRDTPARQHTLFQTMQWSYQLLTAHEQQLFRRLCVFRDGCTFNAIEVVGGHGTTYENDIILDLVPSLIDQSLLYVQQSDEEPRLILLETVRMYGLECLKQSGEEEIVREAHANYYLAYAEEIAPKLMGEEQRQWYQHLDLERENIRAALNWFLISGNGTAALRLNNAIWLFWAHLYLAEGYQWMERSLAVYQEKATAVDLSLLAHSHTNAASLAYYMGNWQQMSRHLDQCVQLFQQLDDKAGLAVARNRQALLALEQEEYATLPALVEEAMALKQHITVPWFAAETMYIASLLAYIQKDYQRAFALGQENLALCRKMGEPTALALTLHTLGLFASTCQDEEAACNWYYETLKVLDPVENANTGSIKAAALLGLAGIAAGQRQYQWAAQLWGAVEALRQRTEGTIGDKRRQWLNALERRQSNYEHMVQMVQKQLGEQTFAACWQEGQTMTLDQLLAPPTLPSLLPAPSQKTSRAPTKATTSTSADILTLRETEVLRLLARGLTSTQIAQQLGITPLTVNSHVRSIYSKLGVSTRSAATRYAIEQKLVE